jgi:2-C-methyl-D-erythritol 4-phosphate cytidylyltransferase
VVGAASNDECDGGPLTGARADRAVWTIVVAAGSGSRFGAAKQFAALGARPVIEWAVGVARRASDGVVLVVPPDRVGPITAAAGRWRAGAGDPAGEPLVVVAGAATRSGSVRAGLAAVPPNAAVVVVHDAARPLATDALFARVIAAVAAGATAAVPGLAPVDTIRRVDGGTVAREQLVAVQTPQAFAAAALRAAHRGDPEASDDASLIEAAGGKVVVVPGEPTNLKLTTPVDLVVARALLADRDAR